MTNYAEMATPKIRVAFNLFRFAVRRERRGRVYSYVSRPFRAPTSQPERAAGVLRAELSAGDTAPPRITLHSSVPDGLGWVWRSSAVSL